MTSDDGSLDARADALSARLPIGLNSTPLIHLAESMEPRHHHPRYVFFPAGFSCTMPRTVVRSVATEYAERSINQLRVRQGAPLWIHVVHRSAYL